jgi:S-DNA-T family DNA segregation ATPase FtsK/SpoIIIE
VWGTAEDGKGANRRGIIRAHITEAVAHRNRNRDAG